MIIKGLKESIAKLKKTKNLIDDDIYPHLEVGRTTYMRMLKTGIVPKTEQFILILELFDIDYKELLNLEPQKELNTIKGDGNTNNQQIVNISTNKELIERIKRLEIEILGLKDAVKQRDYIIELLKNKIK